MALTMIASRREQACKHRNIAFHMSGFIIIPQMGAECGGHVYRVSRVDMRCTHTLSAAYSDFPLSSDLQHTDHRVKSSARGYLVFSL